MPRIYNIDKFDIASGKHPDPGTPSVLIQITNPAWEPPEPHYQHFTHRFAFEFLDLEQEDIDKDPAIAEFLPTADQARAIADALLLARDINATVIVHCTVGVARSGAVVQAAVDQLGFDDPLTYRHPNVYLLTLLNQALQAPTAVAEPPKTCSTNERAPKP